MTNTVCFWCGAKDTLADIGKEFEDGKYKMVQCRKCKNAYYVVNKEKMNKPKPITNEENLRSCSSDELVSILCELVDSGILQEWRIKYHCADSDEDAVRIWLKEKHE